MKKSDFAVLLIAIIAIIAICAIPLIMYLNTPIKYGTASTQISGLAKLVSEVEIRNTVPEGDIYINELPQSTSNIIEANWDVEYSGPFFPKSCVLISYTIINSRIIISIDTNSEIDITSLSLHLYISPNYVYNFISNTENSNINFNIRNIDFKDFYFKSDSGNLELKLNRSTVEHNFVILTDTGDIRLWLDHINFLNNFTTYSNSGVQTLDLWNIRFYSLGNINVSSNTGYIRFYWANHFNKSQHVNINVFANYDFEVKFWCPIEIMRCLVSLFTVEGTTRLTQPTGSFEQLDENHYQTHQINDTSLDWYNFTATCISGEVMFQYVDCFKWSRLCDWTQDFSAYTVQKSGNYTLNRQDYDISSIMFYNTRYIYLNESRYLIINFEALPVSSEKLVFIEWDLEYIHAMGIGVGDINLELSKLKESNMLSIHMKLEFVLDKILPTFTEYNITVWYHPNYAFNEFLIA